MIFKRLYLKIFSISRTNFYLQNRKFFECELFQQFEDQVKFLKKFFSHIGLYLGLIAYTAMGALVRFKYTFYTM